MSNTNNRGFLFALIDIGINFCNLLSVGFIKEKVIFFLPFNTFLSTFGTTEVTINFKCLNAYK